MAITAKRLGATLPIIMSNKNQSPSVKIKQYPQRNYKDVVQTILFLHIPILKEETQQKQDEDNSEPIGFSPLTKYECN